MLAEYEATFAGREHLFADDMSIAYVDQMLIRSYLYHRLRGYQLPFVEFVNRFVTPSARDMSEELVDWLRGEFGIRYYNRHSEGLKIDTDDYERLVHELTTMKRSKMQAENDASTILTVHALRQRNGELNDASQYGYSTWWLSKDINTHKAAVRCFPERLKSNCYMRPDFLNHYIALSPRPEQVSRSFDALFPTLVGVSVSHHIPRDIGDRVRRVVREHNEHQPARVSAIMRRLSDDLRAGSEGGDRIRLFLDDELGKLKTDALKRANAPVPHVPRR